MNHGVTTLLCKTLIATAMILIGLASFAPAQVYVDRNGSAAPKGDERNPYQSVAAGVCKAKPGERVVLRAGSYPETPRLDDPVTLASIGGNSVIGRVNNKGHTTLKVVTYNTHLFGGKLGGLVTFADTTRARLIADRVRDENADVVALQEVWDDGLAREIFQRARYPYYFYGSALNEVSDFLHSGLLLLSKYPLSASLIHYTDEVSISQCPAFDPVCPINNPTHPWDCLTGCLKYLDAFASKGFIQATIVKDGFRFGVFSTHTQAEFHDDAVAARRKQLKQLGVQIRDYRRKNPGAEVIAVGDFNVIGESAEYLNDLLPAVGLRDAFRNAPLCPQATADVDRRITCDFHSNALASLFGNTEDDCDKKRLDYMWYSHGDAFEVLPTQVTVRRYQVSPAIIEDGKSVKDLSDHYGLFAEFSVYR